jgi:sulfide:quinone oxidoreductase
VRPERREAVFSVRKGKARSEDVLGYDLLHVVPPMRPPALLEESGLAHQDGPMKGYLAVDPESLRHRRFDIIFGLGDAVGVEGVKTREQAREQATQVARTLRRLLTTA